jgi:SAM-dependent methyltransferase/glycosyltransferase involved in cell wall biosynthesis
MNILFVSYGGFECINSAIHIFHLANQLVEQGLDCAVVVPGAVDNVRLLGTPRFRCLTYDAAEAGGFGFEDHGGPSLIHAWTPRERVRRLVQHVSRAYGCPYIVHLEDNEEEITAHHAGMPFEKLRALPADQLDRLIPETRSHPFHYREFLAKAAGVTVIIDRLLEFKPDATPGEVLWPGFDPVFAALPERNPELRHGLSIGEDEFVLVYPGNTHASNVEEMRSLYTSVGLLNNRGHKVRLVRFGTDYCDPLDGNWEFVRPYCLELGFRSRQALPGPMAMADALVQPGRPSRFNDYRLPSKLPDFLVSGRPVVLPRTNLGRFLRDGEECLHLEEGDAIDIANKLEALIRDPALRRQIGAGGRDFAQRELDWEPIAAKIRRFYDRVLASQPRGRVARLPGAPVHRNRERTARKWPLGRPARAPRWSRMDITTLEAAASRYAGCFPVSALSYATVQDFCDSYDHLQALATETRDLKDCQRPWTFKAILGTVPYGGRLLEIGAGEPIVAELLSCLGYDVSVVDPYESSGNGLLACNEGSGNGLLEYERFRKQYPEIHILRQWFTEDIGAFDPGTFDCIYSISVLEHIPTPGLMGVFQAIHRLLKPAGHSIHAVDHVVRGAASVWHKTHAARVLTLSGFSQEQFEALDGRLARDPETYYLPAESHNTGRGPRPSSEFPTLAVAGLQICTRRPPVSVRPMAPAAIESSEGFIPQLTAKVMPLQDATGAKALYDRLRLAPILDGFWVASTVSVEPHSLRLTGWAVNPCDQPAEFCLAMNGAPMSFESYAVHATLSAKLNIAHCYYFEAVMALDRLPGELVEFRGSFGSPDSQRSAGSYFWPAYKPVLPEPVRRSRVHGTEEESSFDLVGCTIAEKIKRLLEHRFHKALEAFGPVLDWGCGCGRVSRFLFPSLKKPYGIDIDTDNVDWCHQNLTGDFQVVSVDPPTSLPAGYFELIYGISVFTHLAASDQVKWLEELARLSVPGGLVMVTVHGYTSWLLNDLGAESYLNWERDGILDVGENSDLQGAVPDPTRYRSIFHTPAYIRRVWRKWFEVLDILPGWAANNQDLVILRARDDR